MVKNIDRNVINMLFDHLTKKCICNEQENVHFLNLMLNDVIQIILKVNHGIKTNKWL